MSHRVPAAQPLAGAQPALVAPAEWRAIDFISDLHLAENTPRTFAVWAQHLSQTRADAVFILGDLFEVWVGDDMAELGFEARCAQVLREATRRRTIAFMPGNRDFLVGDALLASCGVARLADPTVVIAFGQRLLVSHGDALCLADRAYQRYRSVVRHPSAQRAFAALPLAMRRVVGRALRTRSDGQQASTADVHVDVDLDAAVGWMKAAGAATLVHGHTHAPASHVIAPRVVRHVLSDWDLDGNEAPRAEVLRWSADGFVRIEPEGGATVPAAGMTPRVPAS